VGSETLGVRGWPAIALEAGSLIQHRWALPPCVLHFSQQRLQLPFQFFCDIATYTDRHKGHSLGDSNTPVACRICVGYLPQCRSTRYSGVVLYVGIGDAGAPAGFPLELDARKRGNNGCALSIFLVFFFVMERWRARRTSGTSTRPPVYRVIGVPHLGL